MLIVQTRLPTAIIHRARLQIVDAAGAVRYDEIGEQFPRILTMRQDDGRPQSSRARQRCTPFNRLESRAPPRINP